MQIQLEKLEKDCGIEWREYIVGDLFAIRPTKNYGLSNQELFKSKGNIPVVSNTGVNNGITAYVDLAPTEKGNIITFSDTTTDEAIFYQPKDFIGYSHIQGMHKKFDENIGKNQYLFIVTAFKNAVRGKYSYGSKFNRANAAKEKIQLPTIIVKGRPQIALDYMDQFIATLNAERIATLNAYLAATGLNDYTLTQKEQDALDGFNSVGWATFEIRDLFDVLSTKKKFNAADLTFNGRYRYIARGEGRNGIRGYINEDEKYLNKGNTISFGQDTATMFYQSESYFTGDKIKIFEPKISTPFNKDIAQIFITSIKKAFSSFSWGSSSYNVSVLNSTKIKLPIKADGSPDYEYMNLVAPAMQKVVIKNLVDYLDHRIDKTKIAIGHWR